MFKLYAHTNAFNSGNPRNIDMAVLGEKVDIANIIIYDISNLAKCTYIIKINTASECYVKRLIVN
jgi:hypothetical protein